LSLLEVTCLGQSALSHFPQSPSPDCLSPASPVLGVDNVRVYNKTLRFHFRCDKSETNVAFRIPTFFTEPKSQTFFRIVSPESFNFIPNVRYELGTVSENDFLDRRLALGLRLRGLNNLEANKRIREDTLELIQRSDSKKIRKYAPKSKNLPPPKGEGWNAATEHSRFGHGLLPISVFDNTKWKDGKLESLELPQINTDKPGFDFKMSVGRIAEFDFSKIHSFDRADQTSADSFSKTPADILEAGARGRQPEEAPRNAMTGSRSDKASIDRQLNRVLEVHPT